MNKKDLSESDIKAKFITPAITGAGFYLNYLHYKGMAGQDNISVTMCKELVIGLPPLAEQKVILDKINSLMQKQQELEQEVKTSEANAKMLMQSVLKEAFEGKKEEVVI